MTDRTLTVEQREEVMRAVMGEDFPPASYAPAFDNGLFYRSQALALVEWLADRIEELPAGHRRFSWMDRLLIAINKRSAAALELLAHSLITGEEK